ncbi:hypothetical protein TI04_02325 [Achromatium sp. WMS2]|nr:hypothetical protein TI04_02325 [Achromatium sp. WMS2]
MQNQYSKFSTLASFALLLGIILVGGSLNLTAAENPAVPDNAPKSAVPMSDAAAEGIGCLALGTPTVAAAYALGPTEIMMLITGAVIVPSSSPQLFIPVLGILGGAACGVGASLTPSVLWMAEQMSAASGPEVLSYNQQKDLKVVAVSDDAGDNSGANGELSEDVIQGHGCLVGALALSAITLATSPIEIVGLAAGGVAVPSNTSILLMGMAGTIVAGGCSIGSYAALPLAAAYRGLGLSRVSSGIASLFNWGHTNKPQVRSIAYVEVKTPAPADQSVVTQDKY